MAIDLEMLKAIERAGEDLSQPASVARVLVAWMEDASSRELSRDDQMAHLENLRRSIELERGGN